MKVVSMPMRFAGTPDFFRYSAAFLMVSSAPDDPERLHLLLEALEPVPEIGGLLGAALRVDHHRQIARQSHRIHVVEEEGAVPAEQILHIVFRGREQHVHAGFVHQAVETLRVERNLHRSGPRFGRACACADYSR